MTDKPSRRGEPPKSDLVAGTGTVIKGAIDALPGGSILTGLWQIRAEKLKEATNREAQKRLDDFFREMLHGDGVMDDAKADALLDDRDFHALLRACLADIESEKTSAYAALARAIATGSVPQEWRRHFILALRDMSANELSCLQKALVARNNQLVPTVGPSMGEGDFLKLGAPGSLQSIVIQTLASKGFAHEGKLSPTGVNFIQTCMKASELTPAAIGYRAWTGLNVAVINYQISDGTMDKLADALCEELRAHCVKSTILAVVRDMPSLAFTHVVLLLGDRNEQLAKNIEHLKHFVRRRPLIVIQTTSREALLPGDLQPQHTMSASGRNPLEVAKALREAILNRAP